MAQHRRIVLALITTIGIAGIAGCATDTGSGSTTAQKQAGAASSQASQAKSSDKDTKSSTDHSEDVTIKSCTKDSTTGFPTAKVTVTNTSSKSSNYLVTVSFNQGSEQLDTGIATINNLNPGSSSTQEATSLKSDVSGTFTCKVEDTTRFSAVG